MLYLKTSLALAACLLMQACAVKAPAPADRPDPSGVSIDLALKVKSADKPIGPETPVAAPVYGEKTTVSFLGDASTLLSNAAKARGTGWAFEVAGPQPRLPIYVQIDVKNVPFVDFLKNVADQLGQRADIEVSGKKIKLRYRAHN